MRSIMSRNIEEDLQIPSWACASVSENRYNCIVPQEWYAGFQQSWCQRQLSVKFDGTIYGQLGRSEAKLMLSRSYAHCITGWNRVSVVVIEKEEKQVISLTNEPLCIVSEHLPNNSKILSVVKKRSEKCLLSDAVQKYTMAIQLTEPRQLQTSSTIMDYNTFVRDTLCKLYGSPSLLIGPNDSATAASSVDHGGTCSNTTATRLPYAGLLNADIVLESSTAFYVVLPFVRYTVADVLVFSPGRLSLTNKLFVLYQILQTVRHLHKLGLSVGNIRPRDVAINDDLWISIPPPDVTSLCRAVSSGDVNDSDIRVRDVTGELPLSAPALSEGQGSLMLSCSKYFPLDVSLVAQRWVYREISNFDYLMFLNRLAGRSLDDPNHYPILPWVIDFTSPTEGFRDLTRTKYRLNKGDEQLDLTYDTSNPESMIGQTPFHVSDFLSDITYYVYMARRTEKTILCRLVRQRWVPAHYPASLERLYQWTPDECTPEFFTDPTIFTSIHDDLPDLELPSWCSSAEDFIQTHRNILEGDYVSENLHHWIDLTFGYKLAGTAAAVAKNVCLQLVDSHHYLLNHGVVQLFSYPHVSRCRKLSNRSFVADVVDCDSAKTLLGSLNSLESLCEFSLRVVHDLPETRCPPAATDGCHELHKGRDSSAEADRKLESRAAVVDGVGNCRSRNCGETESVADRMRARDMQALGCLVAELFLPCATWCLQDRDSRTHGAVVGLKKRYKLIRNYLTHTIHLLHWSIRPALTYLLNFPGEWDESLVDDETGSMFKYPSRGIDDLPPPCIDMLLHPAMRLFTFPAYFESLHRYLLRYNGLSLASSARTSFIGDDAVARIETEKVSLLAQYLTRMTPMLGPEGIKLVLPYVTGQLSNLTSNGPQSAWLLFHPVAQSLSAADTAKHLVPPLATLFDTDETSVKYIKIYHQSFISQLIVRLGLGTFLQTFVTLLVEAAACYKDYSQETNGAGDEADSSHRDAVSEAIGDLRRSSSIVPPITEFILDGELQSVNGMFENDVDSDFGTDQLGFTSTLSADTDDDTISATSASGAINDNSQDDSVGKTDNSGTDGVDSMSVLSENLDSRNESTSGESFGELSGSQPSTASTSTNDDGQSFGSKFDCDDPETTPTGSSVPRGQSYRTSSSSSRTDYNVSNVAAETLKWLSDRIGPVLTAKYISRNLLRMLTLCYVGDDQFQPVGEQKRGDVYSLTGCYLVGDRNAHHVIECLSFVVSLYGQQIVVLQYFQHAVEMVTSLRKAGSMSTRSEATIVACLTLVINMIPLMNDNVLLDVLQVPLLKEVIIPLIELVSSAEVSYPTGSLSRRAAAYKIVDVLYIISKRIGFELTRNEMTTSLVAFFDAFSSVHATSDGLTEQAPNEVANGTASVPSVEPGESDPRYEIRLDSETRQLTIAVEQHTPTHRHQPSLTAMKQHSLTPSHSDSPSSPEENAVAACVDKSEIEQQLRETFTAELANTSYIAFSQLAGGIHMAQKLSNDDLIRHLCMEHEKIKVSNSENVFRQSTHDGGSIDSISVEGNKITIRQESPPICVTNCDKLKNNSYEPIEDGKRHLRGNWLAYWEHEVGRSERDSSFQLKHITLQRFTGHSNSIRSINVLDSENSFVTASKDKTVKLWSVRNCHDGSASVGCQWTYSQHKKPILSLAYIDSFRLIASTDGRLHLWDPFVPGNVRQVNVPVALNHSGSGSSLTMAGVTSSSNSVSISTVVPLPGPSSLLLTASTSDTVLRSVDVRTGKFTHELRTTVVPSGTIHGLAVSPEGRYVAIGYTTGLVSTLDLRTGLLLASWKAHEADILDIKAVDSRRLVTSSMDQTVATWRPDDGRPFATIKGLNDPAHCLCLYKDTLIAASPSNRITVFPSLDSMVDSSSTKLRSDTVRGLLSSIAVLPLNRLLLLGTDNGDLRLVA